MFERYTEPSRRVIFFALKEASAIGAGEIGLEHLLLGICRQDPQALERFGFADQPAVEKLADAIRAALPKPEHSISTSVDLPLTRAAKKVLDDANDLAQKKVEPADLLEAIARRQDSLAASFLSGK